MTNFEAISASLYPYDVDDDLIEKSCIDESVDSGIDYGLSQKIGVAKVLISILRNLIVLSSESNGGYGLSYNVDNLKERIYAVATDNGLTDIAEEFNVKSVIQDISNRW